MPPCLAKSLNKLYCVVCNFYNGLLQGDFKAQKEGIWAVANFTTGGTVKQVVELVRAGVLKPLLDLLTVKDSKTILVLLDTFINLFQVRGLGLVSTSEGPPRLPLQQRPVLSTQHWLEL